MERVVRKSPEVDHQVSEASEKETPGFSPTDEAPISPKATFDDLQKQMSFDSPNKGDLAKTLKALTKQHGLNIEQLVMAIHQFCPRPLGAKLLQAHDDLNGNRTWTKRLTGYSYTPAEQDAAINKVLDSWQMSEKMTESEWNTYYSRLNYGAIPAMISKAVSVTGASSDPFFQETCDILAKAIQTRDSN